MKTKAKFTPTLKTLLYAIMAAVLMFNLSCSPEDGLDGEQGPAGEDGNANVQVYEKDISNMTWEVSSNNDYLYLDIPAPNVLTEETLNTSTILVYVYTSDFWGWGLVPYYTERGIRVTAHISVGNVQLRKDQDGNPSTQSWHNKIRLVIIENSPNDINPLNHLPDEKVPTPITDINAIKAFELQ